MKSMYRIITVLIAISIMASVIAGCDSKKIMWAETNLPGHFKASYKTFTGRETRTINRYTSILSIIIKWRY